MRTMKVDELEILETIEPRLRTPWAQPAFDHIEVIQNQDEVLVGVNEIVHSSEWTIAA